MITGNYNSVVDGVAFITNRQVSALLAANAAGNPVDDDEDDVDPYAPDDDR